MNNKVNATIIFAMSNLNSINIFVLAIREMKDPEQVGVKFSRYKLHSENEKVL